MPARNIIKQFAENEYYHVYNRGVEKRIIFQDEQDFKVFEALIAKYITGKRDPSDKNRHKFTQVGDDVDVISYCLMPNHFHLLLYQRTQDGITKFMRRLATGYAMYFNDKYNRVGALFQGRYKASHINEDVYLQHISRYIHMNPAKYQNYQYSSLRYYLEKSFTPNWLKKAHIMDLFKDASDYRDFLESYETRSEELKELSKIIADR